MNIKIRENVWEEVKKFLYGEDYLLITDTNVFRLYGDKLKEININKDRILVIDAGEINKNINTLASIYEKLLNLNISRKGIIISLGGGVVGDISGFAASTYKRGIKYIQLPTTLLAQVDSSIGGKTAIDFLGYKNAVGSFYCPSEVLISTEFIHTLGDKEILSGLGEIIKYGIIWDYKLFKYIGENISKILNKNLKILEKLIKISISIKSKIVSEDAKEIGLRKILNFGHTIGHGIESYFGYDKYTHGEAVIKGMIYESKIANRRRYIDDEYLEDICGLLIPLVNSEGYDERMVMEIIGYMKNDKKNENGKIGFILPTSKGEVDIFHDVTESEIKSAMLGVD